MFTPNQQEIINADTGHLIVSAVAGSGKTSTLIGRIIRLIESGIDPSRILVLIFGKTVSLDFSARLKVSGAQHGVKVPPVLTFHALGLKLIAKMEERIDLQPAKLITKDSEVSELAKRTLSKLSINPVWKDKVQSSPEFIREFIAMVEFVKSVATAADVASYMQNSDQPSPLSSIKPMMLDGFVEFEKQRKISQLRTFSDLIYDPVAAILDNQDILKYVENRYDHILVDEFQDINLPQWQMVTAVAGTRAKLTVVGDEDQAIFGWRGASTKFTQIMKDSYENVTEHVLPHTFRFGHRLSLAANHIISNNTGRVAKMCISANSNNDTRVGVHLSEMDSGLPAVNYVTKWLGKGKLHVDIAVLVREYSHSIAVESAFLNHDIPYCIVGGEPFFNRSEVLSLRGCLQLASSGLENIDKSQLHSVVNAMLRAPGVYLKNNEIETLCLRVVNDPTNFIGLCRAFENELSDQSTNKYRLREFRSSIDAWAACISCPRGITARSFLENIVRKLGLYEFFNKSSVGQVISEREKMVRGLIHAANIGNYTVQDFAEFLDNLSSKYESSRHHDCILITSIHRAKGMEWPCVIMPELSDSNFPGNSKKTTLEEIHNERNLFYVGITRAKEELVLICPKDPLLVKWTKEAIQSPPPLDTIVASRFIFEGNFSESATVGKSIHAGVSPDSSYQISQKYISLSKS